MNEKREYGVEAAYRRHVKHVYRLCYSYLGNTADAEDATQSVFIKLVDTPRDFENEEHEKAWLLRVAANYCKDVLKSGARKHASDVSIEDVSLPATDAPDSEIDVLQAVLSLPERYKDIVYLHYYEGYKTDEIAQMTDTNPSTVRNRLADARTLLRTALEA